MTQPNFTPEGIKAFAAALKYAEVIGFFVIHMRSEEEKKSAYEDMVKAIAAIPGASRPKARLET